MVAEVVASNKALESLAARHEDAERLGASPISTSDSYDSATHDPSLDVHSLATYEASKVGTGGCLFAFSFS